MNNLRQSFSEDTQRAKRKGNWLWRGVLILALLAMPSVVQASNQVNSPLALPVWTLYSVDAPPYFFNMGDRSLAFNPITSEPCIAHGGDALYFSCYDPIAKTWITEVVDNNLQVGQYTALAFNSSGWPFITYYDAYNGHLKLAYFNGIVWTILFPPNVPNLLVGTLNSSATAPPESDEPSPEPATPEMPEANETVTTEPTPTGETKFVPPPRVTDDETATPAWPRTEEPKASSSPGLEGLAGQPSPSLENQIQATLQPWRAAPQNGLTFAPGVLGYGRYSSIFIDGSDGVHISYHDDIKGALEYLYWDGFSFYGEVVDDYADQGDVGLWSSIQVDEDFNVHIAYFDDKYDDLKYARRRFDTGTWTKMTVDSESEVGVFASLALDKFALPHISYYDFTQGSLKYAYRYKAKDGSLKWDIQTLDGGESKATKVGWFSSIGVSGGTRVHISYYDASRKLLKYARRDGSWTKVALDTVGTRNLGLFTSLAFGPDGEIGISYMDSTVGALKLLYKPADAGWQSPTYAHYYSRDVGLATSLVLKSDGLPFISYLDASSGALKMARLYSDAVRRETVISSPFSGMYSSIDLSGGVTPRIAYYRQEGGDAYLTPWPAGSVGWVHSAVDKTNDVGQYISLAIDSLNLPHLSYYDATKGDLIYARWDTLNSKWITETVASTGNVGLYSDIALSNTNQPFISYYDASTGKVKVSYRIFGWATKEVDTVGGPVGGLGAYTSIALDGTNRPHVSYYDPVNKDLKYAYWSGAWPVGGSWVITTVDATGDVGRFASLALQGTFRHVCYYDYTNGDLKYARWEGADPWLTQIVDSAGDVGYFCAIDVLPGDMIAISYYDNSRADLKAALNYLPPAVPPLPPNKFFLPLIEWTP